MSYSFRLPNITATTPQGQLAQMQSFLYQTVEQLNWALNTIESGTASGNMVNHNNQKSGVSNNQDKAVSTFNEIKSLIIKSADIVNAYYEKINAKLAGKYVAASDFGVYTQNTEAQIKATSEAISQYYTNVQEIITDIGTLESKLIEVNAHIHSGFLYYDENSIPVYGLEIGQKTDIDGVEVFKKYARFTSEKLSFYDQNNYEVAYVSDKTLHITHIEVIEKGSSFTLGKLVDTVLDDGSVVTR